MKITIPCDTFRRIANVSRTTEREGRGPEPYLLSIRLEIKNGMVFCVATDGYMLAVELAGSTEEPDGFVHITNDQLLLDACAAGADSGALLTITAAPGWTVAQAGDFFYPKNAAIETDYPIEWRLFFVNEPTEKRGAFAFDADALYKLGKSSPSGEFVFPAIIDNMGFVIVNDAIDPDWMGVLRSARDEKGARPKPAIVRPWVKA